jgi:hypothetical protein
MKQKLLVFCLCLGLVFTAGLARAGVTPTLSLTSNGDGDTVQVNVSGDPNVGVIFFYTKTNVGQELATIGTTNSSGSLSVSISTSGYGIAGGSLVYVRTNGINGLQSAQVTWPNLSTTGTLSLSQTGISLSVDQSTAVTVNNAAVNTLYVSNNSNPSIANVNISGNQVTFTGVNYGSTVATICATGNSSSVTNSATVCVSAYVTVQNGSASSPLTFSISNVTVSPGQSVPITISGGTGTYTVLTNSNSTAIQSNISGSVITLTTSATTGSAAVTVCSTDMSSCGIINATASSVSSSPLSFSQTAPTLSVGQSLVVNVSGGNATSYYLSNNSNTNAVTATINGSNLSLTGNSAGTATLTLCSSSGSCGSITPSVGYTSSGGTFQLSQTSVSLLVGQVLSVTISGGTTPYTLGSNSGSVFQASLNGNIITISGIASGSSSLNVCTSGGACLALTVTVNASGAGTQLTFSQNNLNLNAGGVTAVTMSGSGGYYVSNSSNPAVASVQINGNTAVVTGLTGGSSNISVCQSGGQCSILFATVTTGASTVSTPMFSQVSPLVSVGQNVTETISGGSGSSYYIAANTAPSVVSLSLNNSQLTISGLSAGSSIIVICASSNSCGSITATVSGSATTSIIFSTTSLPAVTAGQTYSSQILATGGSGTALTYSLSSGGLPAGLALSSTGLISGTPTAAGNSNFSITATDGSGNTAGANLSLMVNSSSISVPTTTPVVTTPISSAGTYINGQLIFENGTVYIVYQNTKVAFANAPAFLGLGFSFKNVTPATNSGLTLSDRVVVTAAGAHPRGSWILGGRTVYFVTPAGNIPVADWNTFTADGGQASFIVKATSYDLARTTLPILTLDDSRLHQ